MKCISLHQPWATLIAEGYKTIETRNHDRFKKLVGQRVGIHAAKKYSPQEVYKSFPMTLQQRNKVILKSSKYKHVFGAIICVVFVSNFKKLDYTHSTNAMIDCSYCDKYGLFLTNIKKIEPIYCRGQQGIFNVDIKEE
jgi:hypothetical protein